MRLFIFVPLLFAVLGGVPVHAQHAIDVQRKTVAGEHYEALLLYQKMPKRRATTDAMIAAGKSAWALGLQEKAITEFDEALRSPGLSGDKKARLLLSRGVLEFQQERYQIAILYVEKLMTLLKGASPLRAKAWVLWGESLFALGQFGAAEEKYETALSEASESMLGDIHYLLGRCKLQLGRHQEARVHFESLPVDHSKTPEAIRSLAVIALETGKMSDTEFWLMRGREQFPEYFIDSWVEYALARVAMDKNDQERVNEIYREAAQKYPPSDHWLTLLAAAQESYRWQQKAQFSSTEGSNGR